MKNKNSITKTDEDIINELLNVYKKINKKPKRTIANEIDKILKNDFITTNKTYTEKIKLLKSTIQGITNSCSVKFAKREIALIGIIYQLGLG